MQSFSPAPSPPQRSRSPTQPATTTVAASFPTTLPLVPRPVYGVLATLSLSAAAYLTINPAWAGGLIAASSVTPLAQTILRFQAGLLVYWSGAFCALLTATDPAHRPFSKVALGLGLSAALLAFSLHHGASVGALKLSLHTRAQFVLACAASLSALWGYFAPKFEASAALIGDLAALGPVGHVPPRSRLSGALTAVSLGYIAWVGLINVAPELANRLFVAGPPSAFSQVAIGQIGDLLVAPIFGIVSLRAAAEGGQLASHKAIALGLAVLGASHAVISAIALHGGESLWP